MGDALDQTIEVDAALLQAAEVFGEGLLPVEVPLIHDALDLGKRETELPVEENLLQQIDFILSIQPITGGRDPRWLQETDLIGWAQGTGGHP
jgi:hypothetical protein